MNFDLSSFMSVLSNDKNEGNFLRRFSKYSIKNLYLTDFFSKLSLLRVRF